MALSAPHILGPHTLEMLAPFVAENPQISDYLAGALALHLLATSSDCIKLIDRDGNLRSMNETGLCMMEVEDFAVIEGKAWASLWPIEGRGQIDAAIVAARQGKTTRFTGFCPTLKGTSRWWEVSVVPVHDNSGGLILLLSIARDVTKQRAVEDSVRTGQQRFRALADNMAQLAWMADAAGSVFWLNQRWFDYTGTALEQMAGSGWTTVHHPDHVDRVVGKLQKCFESGEIWEDTFPLRRADGSYNWFLSHAMPIRDDRSRVEFWCGTSTDITEQRHAGIRLRQKARLIELSHEAILIWDRESGIVSWNRGCVELYGYEGSEAIGAVSHDLLKTRLPMSRDEFENHLEREGGWTGELLHIAKDGSEVWVDSRQEMIEVGGRNVVLESNRDIGERRRADEIRNLLIGELNHRVKNMLAIVQSVAGQTARNSADVEQFIVRFNGRLQSLSSAHSVLTDAFWLGAGLRELIQSQLAVTVGDSHAVMLAGEDVFLPPQTALQLTLLVYELATNALLHGALSRGAGQVAISWQVTHEASAALQLTWAESGGPLVAPPTTRGFGLTLIERSARLPGFDAQLLFEPGGVTCRITLPLPAEERFEPQLFNFAKRGGASLTRAQHPARAVGMPATAAQRILIIGDDALLATDIEDILSGAGYAILTPVSSLAAALKSIAVQSFELAVVNTNLQGMPVDTVLAALEQRRKPFVLVTGAHAQNLAPLPGSVHSVARPIVPARLLEAVRATLRVGRTAAQPHV